MNRINLWASPRNVSTALMYSFAQRRDTQVFDEPLYGHYLAYTGIRHPGQEEILSSMETNGQKVVENLLLGTHTHPVVFFKQMTHHLVGIDWGFLKVCKNVLLIRDPAAFITSYAKVIDSPTLDDIGIKQQWELCQHLQSSGHLTAVLDARELLLNPTNVLGQLCESIGIPFDPNMLSWEAGARPEDGVWAPYWYKNVHTSTGFQPYKEKEILIPEGLSGLVEEASTYYEKLYPLALKAK